MARVTGLIVALFIALIAWAGPADAQSEGQLVFFNQATGRIGTGAVDHLGHFALRTTASGYGTHRLYGPTRNGIFASSETGGTRYFWLMQPNYLGQLELSGRPTAQIPTVASATPFGNYMLFYDGGSGATLYETGNDTTFTPRWSTNSFSPWTNIVATDNHLFFYNRTTGVVAALTTAWTNAHSNFGLVQNSNGTIGKNLRLFVPQGDTIMGYDPTTGNYEIGAIPINGLGTDAYTKADSGVLAKGFDRVARVGPHVVWYDANTGVTLIGRIDRTATKFVVWTPLKTVSIQRGWTGMVATGQDLVFHNYNSGALMVVRVEPTGNLVRTHLSNLGEGFTTLFVSRR